MRHEFKKKSRVLLIDDNYDHLNGIRELLNLEGTFDVVGIATNVTVGLNLIKKYQPDLVLLDMNMPDRDGLQGIVEISKLGLDTKVLALSGYDAESGIIPDSLAGAICGWGFLFPILLFVIGMAVVGFFYSLDYEAVREGLAEKKAEIEAAK